MKGSIEIAAGLLAHPSGALWMPEENALLIADPHLGYGWAQRRRGELGPLRDHVAGEKIFGVLDEVEPEELVLLGDTVHAPDPGSQEREFIEETLRALKARVRLTVVRGNHDRAFRRDFQSLGIPLVECWRRGRVCALHGDRLDNSAGDGMIVLGHLHPSLKIADEAGATVRVPVFLASASVIVLPAFSPFAGGYNLALGMPAELEQFLKSETVEAIAVTGRRAVRLGPLRAGRLELDRRRRTGRPREWR